MSDREVIAAGIRRAIARQGWTTAETARRGGWGQATVAKWCSAGSVPNEKNLNRLCVLLDVDRLDIEAGLPDIWDSE